MDPLSYPEITFSSTHRYILSSILRWPLSANFGLTHCATIGWPQIATLGETLSETLGWTVFATIEYQIIRAKGLKFWENVHLPCRCHLSLVTYHVSRVTCHMSFFFFFFSVKVVEPICGGFPCISITLWLFGLNSRSVSLPARLSCTRCVVSIVNVVQCRFYMVANVHCTSCEMCIVQGALCVLFKVCSFYCILRPDKSSVTKADFDITSNTIK